MTSQLAVKGPDDSTLIENGQAMEKHEASALGAEVTTGGWHHLLCACLFVTVLSTAACFRRVPLTLCWRERLLEGIWGAYRTSECPVRYERLFACFSPRANCFPLYVLLLLDRPFARELSCRVVVWLI